MMCDPSGDAGLLVEEGWSRSPQVLDHRLPMCHSLGVIVRGCVCQRSDLKLRLFTISKQSIHHTHHSQFFGGRGFDAFQCQVKEER